MKPLVRPALTVFVALTLLTGVVYPLVVTALAQAIAPFKANGSIIVRDGKPVGSELVGQSFHEARYFWSRPSASNYNGIASGGSNLGADNPALIEAVKKRVETLRATSNDPKKPIPVDLVTASASGLDPNISPESALYQVDRVAAARKLPWERVRDLVADHLEGRTLGIFGEPRINVLRLNLALDALK